MRHIIFTMLVLSVVISGDLWATNRENPVVLDGDRISVHTEGMPLGELLMMIENKTGVHFTFDELIATKKIFVDFEGLPLSKGIKKIIHPFSWATIYDGTGKLRKVFILGRWKGSGSGISIDREGRNDFLEAPKPGPSNAILYTSKKEPDSPQIYSGAPIEEGSVYFDGPPVDKAYSGSRWPNSQNKILECFPVPGVGGTDHLPVPDPDGAVIEAPLVDKVSPEAGSPNTRDEPPEDVPVPGFASSDHLPIPDS